MLDAGAPELDEKSPSPSAPLVEVAARGDSIMVGALIRAGADPDQRDRGLATALMAACGRDDSEEIVRLLLDSGASVNALDDRGTTALMIAAGAGNVSVVQRLLESGANVNLETRSGRTARIAASENGHREVVELLERAEAARQ